MPHQGSHSYVYEYPRGGSPAASDRPIILKLTHSTQRRVPQILGEIDFTNYLAGNGVNVSRAIPSLDGNLVETLEAESGYFVASAYEKAPGDLVDWREWTPELYERWGALIGRMHALTKSYGPSDESVRRRHWHENRDWHLESSVPDSQRRTSAPRSAHQGLAAVAAYRPATPTASFTRTSTSGTCCTTAATSGDRLRHLHTTGFCPTLRA